MKLLVVEDEAPSAAALKRGLDEEGFAVDLAPDAPAAEEAVAAGQLVRPDCSASPPSRAPQAPCVIRRVQSGVGRSSRSMTSTSSTACVG